MIDYETRIALKLANARQVQPTETAIGPVVEFCCQCFNCVGKVERYGGVALHTTETHIGNGDSERCSAVHQVGLDVRNIGGRQIDERGGKLHCWLFLFELSAVEFDGFEFGRGHFEPSGERLQVTFHITVF